MAARPLSAVSSRAAMAGTTCSSTTWRTRLLMARPSARPATPSTASVRPSSQTSRALLPTHPPRRRVDDDGGGCACPDQPWAGAGGSCSCWLRQGAGGGGGGGAGNGSDGEAVGGWDCDGAG